MRSGPDSCVYIVEAENGMFKIGVTINVKQRALAMADALARASGDTPQG